MDEHHISVWGRTYEEYEKMFNLQDFQPATKILSVANGPSTFQIDAKENGFIIQSVDPIYGLTIEEIKIKFKESYEYNKWCFYTFPERFNVQGTDAIEAILAKRTKTFERFLRDFTQHSSNYTFEQLPELKSIHSIFDVCLCSNFLFIFDHIFDFTFHSQSIKEMLRVAKEVRIFPLYDINGSESKNLKPVLEFLDQSNYKWSINTNDYFVYKDGNKFLQIFGSKG